MRSFSKKKIFSAVALVCGAVLLSGCSFKASAPEKYQVQLEVWGVFDDSDAYQDLFSEYQKLNPYVTQINYRKLSIDTYKEDLLNALAAGKGPDIFMIRNAWRGSFEDKVVPAPDNILTEKQYQEAFADVVGADFVKEGKIYGVPLSADSLALYYNKDLLNAAGISRPPATWEELQDDVQKLSQIDALGNINQSAVALGTAYNINRSTDILTVLMLQMDSSLGKSETGRLEITDEQSRQALEFYTQFSNIGSSLYSWNPRLHYSIDAFYEGTLGMMVNYSWQIAALKQKNAKLNFGVAPLPQFEGKSPVNFANYWGFAVAKNKPTEAVLGQAPANGAPQADPAKQNFLRIHESWQLLNYLALPHPSNSITLQNGITGTGAVFALTADPTKKYLEKTGKPAARRDLIEAQQGDIWMAPFALGNLIAKNPYPGNPEGIEAIFAEMINVVNTGEKTLHDALSTAAQRINVLRF